MQISEENMERFSFHFVFRVFVFRILEICHPWLAKRRKSIPLLLLFIHLFLPPLISISLQDLVLRSTCKQVESESAHFNTLKATLVYLFVLPSFLSYSSNSCFARLSNYARCHFISFVIFSYPPDRS